MTKLETGKALFLTCYYGMFAKLPEDLLRNNKACKLNPGARGGAVA
jgi:hypothetical protein